MEAIASKRNSKDGPIDYSSELLILQSNYDEFVISSKEIEEELENELERAESEINKISRENENLTNNLRDKHKQISSLEKELVVTKRKLANESNLRIAAELGQDKAEENARYAEENLRQVQANLVGAKKELEAVHEKLAFTEEELEEMMSDLKTEKQVSLQLSNRLKDVESSMEIERENDDQNEKDRLTNDLNAAIRRAENAERKLTQLESTLLGSENKMEFPAEHNYESSDIFGDHVELLVKGKTEKRKRSSNKYAKKWFGLRRKKKLDDSLESTYDGEF